MISTYSELQSAVAGWLNRSDLTARIPDFITLAESRLNRRLKLRVMETEATLSVSSGAQSVALPTGYIEPMGLWADDATERRELRYLDPVQMPDETAAGTIHYWTITGENIAFERPSSEALSLTLRYLKAFALSDAEPANWLLTNHPDVYLFATLVEAAPYERDTEALGIWSARLEGALTEIENKEARSRSLTTLSVDPALTQRTSAFPRYGSWRGWP